VIAAGWKILYVIAREAFGDFDRTGPARPPRLDTAGGKRRTCCAHRAIHPFTELSLVRAAKQGSLPCRLTLSPPTKEPGFPAAL
jgi:hypothetical protein